MQPNNEDPSNKYNDPKRDNHHGAGSNALKDADLVIVFCLTVVVATLFNADVFLINFKQCTRDGGILFAFRDVNVNATVNQTRCHSYDSLKNKGLFHVGAGLGSFVYGSLASAFGGERVLILCTR